MILALLVVLVGCPGGKPAVKRGKRPTKGGEVEPAGKGAAPKASAELAAFGMADAVCYIRAKPAALVGSQAFKRSIEGAQKLGLVPAGALKETIGKETGVDIDQVKLLNAVVAGDLKRFLLAALFETPYDAEKIMESGLRKFGSHKGVDLLRPEGAEENVALALASPTVLAQGELEAIKSSIDRMKAASSGLGARRGSPLPPAVK